MKTCLVIDNSEVVRKVACQIFEHLQFETSEAETGRAGRRCGCATPPPQQALEGCGKAMPDAILLDSHIPSMGTVEFAVLAQGPRRRQQADDHLLALPRTIRARSCAPFLPAPTTTF